MPALTQEIKESRQIKIGINSADSGTFKTPSADSATYVELSVAPVVVDFDFKQRDIPGDHGTRTKTDGDHVTNEKGSMPKFNLDGVFSVYNHDDLLFAWMQRVTEGVSSPYTKTLQPFSTHPIFSNPSEGHYLTMLKGFPTIATSQKFTSFILADFELKCDRDADDGYFMMSSNCVSMGAVDKTSTGFEDGTFKRGTKGPAGADAKDDEYGYRDFTDISFVSLDFDGSASPLDDRISLKSFSVKGKHEVAGQDPDGDGSYENYAIDKREMSVEIELLKDSQLEQALANVAGNDACTFTVRFGSATAGATAELDVEIIAHFKIDGDGIEIVEDGVIGAKIKGTLTMNDAQTIEALTINIANEIDRGW